MTSNRIIRCILDLWLRRLTAFEKEMLLDYFSGLEIPDERDPFPGLGLNIDFTGMAGPMLVNQKDSDFHMLSGKLLYKLSVQWLNKRKLSGRTDTVWRELKS